MTQAFDAQYSLGLFLYVCIVGLLKNSGITASPLPNQEKVYLLTTAMAPYCGMCDFVIY